MTDLLAQLTMAPVSQDTLDEWVRLRCALWPDASVEEHESEADRFLGGDRHVAEEVFLALDQEGAAAGFIELSLRSHAAGCSSGRIAYVEGWYVDPAYRRHGLGAQLQQQAVVWARKRGCKELASDALLANTLGQDAHRKAGFEEVERVVCFRKLL